jgi:hypothetical protein
MAWSYFQSLPKPGTPVDLPCGQCGVTEKVVWHQSRTAYHWEPPKTEEEWVLRMLRGESDPNAPHPLCPECVEYDIDYWDSMWDEYYSGLL